jgi:hypothetical protein
MADFSSGVKRYIFARAVVENAFPVDWRDNPDVCCRQCNFYQRSTQRCALNQSIVEYPEKYVGSKCPLEFISEEEENV